MWCGVIPFSIAKSFAKNRIMIAVVLAYVASKLFTQPVSTINQYVFMVYFQDTSILSLTALTSMIPMVLGMILIKPLVKRFGKKNLVTWPVLFSAICYGLTAVLPMTPMTWIICQLGATIGAIGAGLLQWSLISDAVDYQAYITGVRNDGTGNLTVGKDVTISGVTGTTTGTGRGNAIATNGKMYVKGSVTISGVTVSGNTDNSSNNGIYGKGLLDVLGNVTITDKVAAGHGIFLDQGQLLADGNIEVNGCGTGKQGIYAANETVTDGVVTKTAAIEGANVTVKDAGGNGIYVRHASNKLTATGTITVETTGQHGINNGGTVSAAAVVDHHRGENVHCQLSFISPRSAVPGSWAAHPSDSRL